MAKSERIAEAGASTALPIGYRLGEYAIKAVLGHGGFGITYLAKDTRLGAEVAIKEYFPQAFASRGVDQTIRPRTSARPTDAETYNWGLQEFLKEAQALAKFKHNHIVRVLRFLEANGTAYMVMEYEKGESLSDYLKKHAGFVNEPTLLKIFLPILSGLQAVHDAGLLHLDIKPNNIYLRESGQPMLIDFGSARQAKTNLGPNHKVALTRGYSAIEHYPGRGKQGPWTDVYSIGATLYRCITGREPIDVMERHQSIKSRGVDPLKPATEFERPLYSSHIRNCVDEALKIPPEDRPQSASAIQNGLMGKSLTESLSSHPGAYGSGFIGIIRTAAAVTRRRVANRSGIEKFVGLLIFLATAAIITPKILIDTGQMTQEELFDHIDAYKHRVNERVAHVQAYIDERVFGIAPPPKPAPPPILVREAPPTPPPFNLEREVAQTLNEKGALVNALVFLRDGKQLAAAGDDGRIVVWDLEASKRIRTFNSPPTGARALAVSPDGRLLAMPAPDHSIVVWDSDEGKDYARLPGHNAAINAIVFSPDGQRLVSASDDKVVASWDLEQKRRLQNVAEGTARVLSLAFSPNGRLLVAGDDEGGIRFWDGTSMKELAYSQSETDRVIALAFSPDNKWLVSGGSNGHLKLWKIGFDRDDRLIQGAPDTVHSLKVSPNGRWIILAGTDESVQLWEIEKGELVHQWRGEGNDIYAIATTADGSLIAAAGDDRTIRIWR